MVPFMKNIFILENEIYNKCNECHKKRKPLKTNNQICIICHQTKLLYIPSGNKIIDEFVRYAQINFAQESSRFIPYYQFKDLKKLVKEGLAKFIKLLGLMVHHIGMKKKKILNIKILIKLL